MGMCFVPDCKHYSEKHLCRFFRFPSNGNVKRKWIKNIRRQDRSPSQYSKVCSCHFKDGIKKNLPTIFERNKDKVFMFNSLPKEKKSRRSKKSLGHSSTHDGEVEDESVVSSDMENSFIAPDNDFERESATPILQDSPILLDGATENGIHASTNISNVESSSAIILSDPTTEFEKYLLEKENVELKTQIMKLEKHPFSFNLISGNNKLVQYYTGIPESEIFNLILNICTKNQITYYAGWNVESISKEDQLLMALMKLKLNSGHLDLSTRFGVSIGAVSNIVLTWLHVLHEIFFVGMMNDIPSVEKNRMCLPSCFYKFSNCRVVVDCTEINTNIPKRMDHQRLFYSNYKHRNTMKALVAVAPNGVISYVSDLYPGSSSDKDIFKSSNIYCQLKPGDLVLADKGFLISDLVPPGVNVNIPPFLFSPQFTPAEIEETENIARARIHVERAIRRIKVFQITKCIPRVYFKFATKIFQVCAALTNFEEPLVREVKHLYFASS